MLKDILGYDPLEKRKNKPNAQKTPRRWEYKLLVLRCYVAPEDNAAKLNELADEGWEIVDMIPVPLTNDADCALGLVLFKRSCSS